MLGHGAGPEEHREGGQLAVGHLVLAEHPVREFHRVHHREVRPGQVTGLARGHQEADVEWRVVGGEHAAARESQEGGQHLHQRWGGRDHRVADASERRDPLGNRAAGIDQRRELPQLAAGSDPDRAYLGDLRRTRGPPGRLDVDDDEVDLIERAAPGRCRFRRGLPGDHGATVGRGTDSLAQARRRPPASPERRARPPGPAPVTAGGGLPVATGKCRWHLIACVRVAAGAVAASDGRA